MSDTASTLLDPGLLDETGSLSAAYKDARPFRHVVMEPFFREDFCRRLLDAFPPFDEARAMDENGRIGGKCVHEQLPGLEQPYRELDALIKTPEFLEWLGTITGIPELLYDPEYFGGGTHENRHGQDLDPHVDFNKHPTTGWHRRLNLIVYLNREWREEWGGAIEFHSDPRRPPEENEVRYVQPKFNRAVLFETTRWSWHGFERINLPEGDADPRSRKSVALYFYSRERPEEEQTKPHSTIYVERPLPSHIQPGRTLGEEDFLTIRRLIDRRDQHLQRLYGYISDLSAQVEDLIEQRDRAVQRLRGQENTGDGRRGQSGLVHRAGRWLGRRMHHWKNE